MRRIMWFTIGFAMACGLCTYCLPSGWILPLMISILILGLICGFWGGSRIPLRRVAYCLVGCAMGLGWFLGYRIVYLMPAIELDSETRAVTIQATDYSYETAYGMAFEGTLTLEGKSYNVKAYTKEKSEIEPGTRVRGGFRFRVTTPDGEKGSTYHKGNGIFLLCYQSGNVEISAGECGAKELPAVLRRQITDILQTCFPEDIYPFALALLLGDKTELDYETETSFEVSGISHIVAVSGLHVSILYGLLSVLTLKRRLLSTILSLPVLVFFSAVAGFTPSVTRACIMVCLMILSNAFNKEYDGPTSLAFACLVMLIINPMVITSVGLQLSAVSVAGIFLFYGDIHNWINGHMGVMKGKGLVKRLKRGFSASVAITLSATSLTTPLCAYYFGTVSMIGVVTNLLTLWAANLFFYGIIAVCVFALLSVPVATFLASILAWLGRYVLFVARICAGIPMAAVYTCSVYIAAWVVFLYVLLIVFYLSKKRKTATLACCVVLGLCVALIASWCEPLMDDCRVTILDVGQGQCILLQSEGKTYMVDCGGDVDTEAANIAAETILSQGITQLDGIIVTHGDADHAGGVAYLLTRIGTDVLFIGEGEDISAYPEENVISVRDTVKLSYGDAEITIFGPIYSGESNENSLCVLFETETCAILITGDRSAFGERMLLRNTLLPDVDLLIAGHHGSKYSTSEELLKAVSPETVIISVGENTYGHPAPELLMRLNTYGCIVFTTEENGTIIYRR